MCISYTNCAVIIIGAYDKIKNTVSNQENNFIKSDITSTLFTLILWDRIPVKTISSSEFRSCEICSVELPCSNLLV